MDHDLAPSSVPDCIVEMPARFAEPMVSAARIAQRMLEIQRTPHSILGVLVTVGEPLYGPIDVARASISNASNLSSYAGSGKLDAQKAVGQEFRRIFNGTMRSAMASLNDAFDGARTYLVFYEEGVCAIVPARTGQGRWRLAALRFADAWTMDEERACVNANRSSLQTYGIVWNMLVEIARREIESDPNLRADLMDEPDAARSWRSEGDGRPDFPPVHDSGSEDDFDPWVEPSDMPDGPSEPWDGPAEPWAGTEASEPWRGADPQEESPPSDGDRGDGTAHAPYDEESDVRGGSDRRSVRKDDSEEIIDDQAVDLEDPTDPSKGRGRVEDDDQDGEDVETINF